jgi:hypothetical protein
MTQPDLGQLRDVDALHALSDILLRRYSLRDLLWCEPCDGPKVPVLLGRLSRYFACSDKSCPHPALPAKITEYRVWSRYVRQKGLAAPGVPRERQHDVLQGALHRVIVCGDMTILRLEWRG